MSIAAVQTRFCYGLKGNVAKSVTYLDERTVLYPSGANLVLGNADRRTQKFIPLSPGTRGATALAVSPNKRYVAVAEKKAEKPTITIYDLTTLKKKKVFGSSAEGSYERYVSIAFSPDSKSLVSQSDGPEWNMCLWQWEKGKPVAQIKSNGNTTYHVREVSFNPQDNTQVCAVGEKTFKLFRLSEGNLKQFAMHKLNQLNYYSHAWLSEDQIIVGSDCGRLQLFEVGDLKNDFEIGISLAERTTNSQDVVKKPSHGSISVDVSNLRIDCICLTSKGLVCSANNGALFVFERTDDPYVFQELRSVCIADESSASQENLSTKSEEEKEYIVCMSLSPSEETLVCATSYKQLLTHTLATSDLTKGLSASAFDHLSSSFHRKTVTGMDVCLRKPIIATCSEDKTIRVWNYENNSLDLHKEFTEEAHSIALHPSGLYVLVGFSEKLRLMSLLINDIRPCKEFLIRGCRECAFSHGGHLFAAANTNLIQLFSTFSYENTNNLKGHNGKVRCIKWSPDDTQIVSCSMDGAVYEWNVLTGKREKECVVKSSKYTSLAVTSDLRTTFVVSTDSTLSELFLAESNVVRSVATGDTVLSEVVLSGSGRMLFAGGSSGSVRAIKFPLSETGEFAEHQAHSAPVTRLRISHDDNYLFSVSADGSLFCHKVTDRDGRGYRKDKDMPFAEEVLVTKSEMDELNSELMEYKSKVGELRSENDYQLRLKDMNYGEKIKGMKNNHDNEMEKLRAQYETVKTDREREQADYETKLGKMDQDHSTELQDIDESNNKKLMTEYEKYQELQSRSLKIQEEYERRIEEMEEAREKALQEVTNHYETKLEEKDRHREQESDEHRQQQREADEMLRQTEEDADEEILQLKNNYEWQLRRQQEECTKLKGELSLQNKKVGSLQDDIRHLKERNQQLTVEVKKRDNAIASLKTDIEGLRREIQERDDTIQDKEKRIFDLKKKNQELEKFKFVLDYKIKELRKQMEPRENELKRMKEQIQKMEEELGMSSRDIKSLELELEQRGLQINAKEKEIRRVRQTVESLRTELRNIKTGLDRSSQFIQEPKHLKEAVKELYRKHLEDFKTLGHSDSLAERDMETEYGRQREHMERSVASLRKKLAKDTEIHRKDNIRVMQENVGLLKEINDLRAELKKSRSMAHDLEAVLKIARKQGFDETAALASTVPQLPQTGLVKVEPPPDSQRVIEIQRAEISRLRGLLREMESGGGRRPSSGTRLPPMAMTHSSPLPVL